MRTNLAIIDATITSAIDREARNPTVPAEQMADLRKNNIRVIAGFSVADDLDVEVKIDELRAKRQQKLKTFRISRDELRERLEKAGITPLAIWPKSAFETICIESGLYLFDPDLDGRIRVAAAPAEQILSSGKNTFWTTWGVATLFAAASMVTAWLMFNLHPVFTSLGFFAITAAGYFLADQYAMKQIMREAKRFGEQEHAKILATLLPGNKKPEYPAKSFRAPIALPDPPPEVVSILVKAKEFSLNIAADGNAIAFAKPPADLIVDYIKKKQDDDRRELWANLQNLFSDPIVYTERGSAVAIITQFGEFPLEKEVVDRVVNSDHLI